MDLAELIGLGELFQSLRPLVAKLPPTWLFRLNLRTTRGIMVSRFKFWAAVRRTQ